MVVDVRDPGSGRLLFKFDADGDIIEIKRGGVVISVSLKHYRQRKQDKPLDTEPGDSV